MSGLDCDRWERRGQWLSRLGRTKLYWHCWLLNEIPQLGGRRKCAHQRTGVARFTVNAWPMGFFQQNTLFPDMEKTNAMQVDWTSPQQKPPQKKDKNVRGWYRFHVPHCSPLFLKFPAFQLFYRHPMTAIDCGTHHPPNQDTDGDDHRMVHPSTTFRRHQVIGALVFVHMPWRPSGEPQDSPCSPWFSDTRTSWGRNPHKDRKK